MYPGQNARCFVWAIHGKLVLRFAIIRSAPCLLGHLRHTEIEREHTETERERHGAHDQVRANGALIISLHPNRPLRLDLPAALQEIERQTLQELLVKYQATPSQHMAPIATLTSGLAVQADEDANAAAESSGSEGVGSQRPDASAAAAETAGGCEGAALRVLREAQQHSVARGAVSVDMARSLNG